MASKRSKSTKVGEVSYAQAIDAAVAEGNKRKAGELIRKQMMVEYKEKVTKALEAFSILQKLKTKAPTAKKSWRFGGRDFTKDMYSEMAKNVKAYIKELAKIHDDNVRRAKNPTKGRKFPRSASRRVPPGLTRPIAVDRAVMGDAQRGAVILFGTEAAARAALPVFFDRGIIARQAATTLLRAYLAQGAPDNLKVQGGMRSKTSKTGVSTVASEEKALPLSARDQPNVQFQANASRLAQVVQSARDFYANRAQVKDAEAKSAAPDSSDRKAAEAERDLFTKKARQMGDALAQQRLSAKSFPTAITPFLTQLAEANVSAQDSAAAADERKRVTEANVRAKGAQ